MVPSSARSLLFILRLFIHNLADTMRFRMRVAMGETVILLSKQNASKQNDSLARRLDGGVAGLTNMERSSFHPRHRITLSYGRFDLA